MATLTLASMGAKRIDVLFIGKAGTFALMTGLSLLPPAATASLVAAGLPDRRLGKRAASVWSAAWAALIGYVEPAREALRSGRAARAGSRSA